MNAPLLARAVAVAAGLSLAIAGFGAAAQVKPGQETALGIVGPQTPDELKRIQEDPYALPTEPGCAGVARELASLDSLLGPDVDAPKEEDGPGATQAAGAVVKSLIPYRSVVRLVTGAGKKEQDLVDASMAGSARRGYLRGLQTSMNCNGPAPAADTVATPAAAVAAEPAPTMSAPPGTADYVPALDDPPARPAA